MQTLSLDNALTLASPIDITHLDKLSTKELQTLLNAAGFNCGDTDGIVGRKTRDAFTNFKRSRHLNQVTVISPSTLQILKGVKNEDVKLSPQPIVKRLSDEDFARVANSIGCNVAAVRAVVQIESAGSGFLADGRPKILFEAHHFSRLTKRRFDGTHPSISSKSWNRRLYKGGAAEWARLDQATALDREAALKSASWGLGQVMGFNYAICGYSTIQSFVNANFRSEGDQLDIMFAFIKSNKLDKHLRSLNWDGFARGYNGASYAVHGYHTKLASAYQKIARK